MAQKLVLLGSVSIFVLAASGIAQAQTVNQAIELQAINVEGQSASKQSGAPGVISTEGYVAKSTRSATKTDTPLLEVPQSVSTVTQQQLEDRKPQNLQDALTYTPGVRIGAFGFDPRYDSFTIRGIDVTYSGVFRDGLRQLNSPNGLFRLEPYGLEAISILKGPASSIYGASSTGGIVDLITKRPTETPFHEIELQTGSYDRLQGNVDFSGPVNDSGSVLYRFTGVARNADTDIDGVPDDRVYVAPALTFKPNEDTKLILLTEYMDSTTGGTVAYVNTYDGPFSTGATHHFGGDPDFNEFRQKQGRIGWEFEHRFNDTFTLHQNTRYSDLSTHQEYNFGGFPGLVKEDTGGLVTDTNLVSTFNTGPVGHELLTGLDVSYLHYKAREAYGDFTTEDSPYLPYVYDYKQNQTLVGAYAQDQMAFGGWRLTVGGRHDWLDSTFVDAAGDDHKQNEGKFTGRAALSYITPWGIAPYVSWGTSFTPNPGTVLDGSVAVPTTGRQVEAGVKYDIPATNVSLRAAVFDIKQKNAVVYQVENGVNTQTQLDLTSRGVEIEGTATFDNGWSLLASYSYNHVEIDQLTDETEGNQLSSVPYHTFSVWADYTVQSGIAKGLGLGAGVRYVGSSFGDNLHRSIIDNEARTFVDASLRYDLVNLDKRLEGAQFQINATNLLNEKKQVCSSNYCYFDEGRKIIASVRYRW